MTLASEIDPQPVGTFWMLNLAGTAPDALQPRIEASFERVDPEAAFVLSQAMGLDNPSPVLARFAAGRRCYGAMVGEALAAYGWVTFDEEGIGEIGLRVRLAPGEAYIWDCVTLPAYRGQRLYPALLAQITAELRAEGFHRAWIGADRENLASQKGMVLAGFQPVADILIDGASRGGYPWLNSRPGVPAQIIKDVHHALFGDQHQASRTGKNKR